VVFGAYDSYPPNLYYDTPTYHLVVTNFGVCGVGACGFWRYRMHLESRADLLFNESKLLHRVVRYCVRSGPCDGTWSGPPPRLLRYVTLDTHGV